MPFISAKGRAIARRVGGVLLLLLGLGAVGVFGPWVVNVITPTRLADTGQLIDQIWWPATGLRVAVYVVLAWGVYPLWVEGRRRPLIARLEALSGMDDEAVWPEEQAALRAQLAQLDRARQRQWGVFALFLVSDLLLAQGPYAWIRG